MSPELAAHLTRAIKDRVEAHHESVQGLTQWYADDLAIDCDADEFWKVVERALVEAGPPDTPLAVPSSTPSPDRGRGSPPNVRRHKPGVKN